MFPKWRLGLDVGLLKLQNRTYFDQEPGSHPFFDVRQPQCRRQKLTLNGRVHV